MQFAVPQFTDVEDKLIGPLTLKQFLMLLAVAGILFFFWSILGIGPIFYLVALPIAALGAYVTFKNFNGRPFFYYLLPLISYVISPKAMIFMREPSAESFTAKKISKPGMDQPAALEQQESAESRLKKLAYLLDNKQQQESEIIREATKPKPRMIDLNLKPGTNKAPANNSLNPLIQHVARELNENSQSSFRSQLTDFPKPASDQGRPASFNPNSILPTNVNKE